MSRHTFSPAPQRTFSDSYIKIPNAPEAWRWFPPAPEPRRPPMAPGELRAALLQAETYLDAALDAQIEGDDDAMRDKLEVLRAIVEVALGQISSSEYLRGVH